MYGLGVGKLASNLKIMILFSGGVDSFLVALTAGNIAQAGVEIILVNVAFGETSKVGNIQKQNLEII